MRFNASIHSYDDRFEDDDGRVRQPRGGASDRLLLSALGSRGRLQILLPEDPAEAVRTRFCTWTPKLFLKVDIVSLNLFYY